jgi:hypothetical protein
MPLFRGRDWRAGLPRHAPHAIAVVLERKTAYIRIHSMRKSREVPLTLLAAVAIAATTGCRPGPTEVRNCVDGQGHIVPDGYCGAASHGGGGVVPVPIYRYVYGGSSGGRVGDSVFGGSSEPASNARVVSGETGAEVGHASSVSRGGFGAHGGEGGGE